MLRELDIRADGEPDHYLLLSFINGIKHDRDSSGRRDLAERPWTAPSGSAAAVSPAVVWRLGDWEREGDR
jgi:hypothetical protein